MIDSTISFMHEKKNLRDETRENIRKSLHLLLHHSSKINTHLSADFYDIKCILIMYICVIEIFIFSPGHTTHMID